MINLPNINTSLVRKVIAGVELYNGSTLVNTFKHDGALQSISLERVGEEGKFFGFGVCQKLKVTLRDVDRSITFPQHGLLKVYFDSHRTSPTFHITEINRDENTNQISLTAYDGVELAGSRAVSELSIKPPYTIKQFAESCASLMGYKSVLIKGISSSDTCFSTNYPSGANFEGSETIREAMTAVAEATQTVFFLDNQDRLVFKRLSKDGVADFTITKDLYFSLSSKTNRRLTAVCHATELGDNVIADISQTGTTQYVRDNPFWELRDDIATLVDNALAGVADLTINQFDCAWCGDYRLEIGDKLALITKDNKEVYSYVLNDVINYSGVLSQNTQWKYTDVSESPANPATLGDTLKQTFAKVDKANKTIDIVTSDLSGTSEKLSALELTTGNISATVKDVQKATDEALDGINKEIQSITTEVEAKMDSKSVDLKIKEELEKGVDKVTTSTGFTFDKNGLTIDKSESEMTTTITEDGMKVFRNGDEVLVANNVGVEAKNLHATTYLIIGSNSRIEDYGHNRTGVFWIGS